MELSDALKARLTVEQDDMSSRYWACVSEAKNILQSELAYHHLDKSGATVSPVFGRMKDVQGILRKAAKVEPLDAVLDTYEDLDCVVGDVAGVRVVLSTLDPAREIFARLREYSRWQVNQPEAEIARDTGYHAVGHLDVMLPLEHFGYVRCEVQVHTMLQNSWGTFAHPVYELRRLKGVDHSPEKIAKYMTSLGYNLNLADEIAQMLLEELESWRNRRD